MRSRFKFIEKEGLYFLTSTTVEWLPIFTEQIYFDIVIDSLKFCQNQKGLDLHAYVILDNHFHLIASAPELSGTIASLKKFTARQIIDTLKECHKDWLLTELAFYKKKYKINSQYQLWQEGSHPQLILSEKIFRQKIEYIHHNPLKRGLVDLPEHWRYSSARNYFRDDHSIIEICRLI